MDMNRGSEKATRLMCDKGNKQFDLETFLCYPSGVFRVGEPKTLFRSIDENSKLTFSDFEKVRFFVLYLKRRWL